jgi:hypothetical protein
MNDKPLSWGHRQNNLHDQVGPLHVLKDNGAPACGCAYFTTGGAEHTTGSLAELKTLTSSHATCFRCRRIAETRLTARETVANIALLMQKRGMSISSRRGLK